MRKISLGATVALMLLSAAVTVSLTYTYAMDRFNEKISDLNEREALYNKLSEIDDQARNRFAGQVDESVLQDAICAGYAAGLSNSNVRYMSAERYADYASTSQGVSVGVGINTVMDEDGNMEIVEVYASSSAETAGLKKGDVVVALDGKEVSRIGYIDACAQLDGADGSQIAMTVLRPDGDNMKTLNFTVVRSVYAATSVSYQFINGNVGYVRISAFGNSSVSAFRTALTVLQSEENLCGLVIDLRGNSDSDVSNMEKLADMLLPAGEIVRTVDKNGELVDTYLSDAECITLPITVVVDSSTAGAAEVMASALHDAGYETVGETTAGTAQVTEVVVLSDGSALFIPTENYSNQNGEVLYGQGVAADVPVSLNETEQEAFSRYDLLPENDPMVQSAVTRLLASGAKVEQVPGSEEAEESQASSEEESSSQKETSEKEEKEQKEES